MLPDKMAFWNSLVPSLTEPQPTMAPIIPPTTKPKPVTVGPTAKKEAVASKGKDCLFFFLSWQHYYHKVLSNDSLLQKKRTQA